MRNLTVWGRLGSDSSVETTKNGIQFIKFSLATQEFNEKETTWFNVVSFDQQIIKMSPYYKKGTLLLVEGKFSLNKYVTKDNVPGQSLEIVAHYCNFLPGSKDGNNGGETTSTDQITPEQMTTTPKASTKKAKPADVPSASISNVPTADEDDLPF